MKCSQISTLQGSTAKLNTLKKPPEKCTKAILKAVKESIPRGARKDYIANWSPELAKLHQETIDTRAKAETQPSVESNIAMKKAAAKYRIASNTAARENWQEKTASLNYEKDGRNLWNLVKSMNGEYDNRQSPLVIEKDDETLTGKAAANALIKQYQYVGHVEISEERKEEENLKTKAN